LFFHLTAAATVRGVCREKTDGSSIIVGFDEKFSRVAFGKLCVFRWFLIGGGDFSRALCLGAAADAC
jgi:hypothetical protein